MFYNNLLSFVTQSFTQTSHAVPLYHPNSTCTIVLTTVLPWNLCHICNIWVGWDLPKIYSHTGNVVIETEKWYVLLTVSTWYKQTVNHRHIYKLEMITKCVVNALTSHVKIVHCVLWGNVFIWLDINATLCVTCMLF